MRKKIKLGTRLSVEPLKPGNLLEEMHMGWHSNPLYEMNNLKARIAIRFTEDIPEEIQVELTRLLDLIACTEEHIAAASLNQSLVCMYQIGEAVGRLNQAEYWLEGMNKLTARGLNLRNAQLAPFEAAKDACQAKAKEYWDWGDTRCITAMAEEMRHMILKSAGEFGLQYVPGLETIKRWLREIAPEHAKKPGKLPMKSPY